MAEKPSPSLGDHSVKENIVLGGKTDNFWFPIFTVTLFGGHSMGVRPLLVPRQGPCGVLQLGVFCCLLSLQSHEENAPVEFCSLGPAPAEPSLPSSARRVALVPLAPGAQLQRRS